MRATAQVAFLFLPHSFSQILDWHRTTYQFVFVVSFDSVWMISTKDQIHKEEKNFIWIWKVMPGSVHGRRDDRLLLLWLAVRQSRTQASILHCSRHSGGSTNKPVFCQKGWVSYTMKKTGRESRWNAVPRVDGWGSNECFPGTGWASFWLDPQLLGLCASQVTISS